MSRPTSRIAPDASTSTPNNKSALHAVSMMNPLDFSIASFDSSAMMHASPPYVTPGDRFTASSSLFNSQLNEVDDDDDDDGGDNATTPTRIGFPTSSRRGRDADGGDKLAASGASGASFFDATRMAAHIGAEERTPISTGRGGSRKGANSSGGSKPGTLYGLETILQQHSAGGGPPTTPKNAPSTVGKGVAPPMTLKEQEEVIDRLTKESFNLKLKISFLEERLSDMSPENSEKAVHELVDLKVQLKTMENEARYRDRVMRDALVVIEKIRSEKSELERALDESQSAARMAQSGDVHRELYEAQQRIRKLEDALRSDPNAAARFAPTDDAELERVIQERNAAEHRYEIAQRDYDLQATRASELEQTLRSYEWEMQQLRDEAAQTDNLKDVNRYLRDQVAEYKLRTRELEDVARRSQTGSDAGGWVGASAIAPRYARSETGFAGGGSHWREEELLEENRRLRENLEVERRNTASVAMFEHQRRQSLASSTMSAAVVASNAKAEEQEHVIAELDDRLNALQDDHERLSKELDMALRSLEETEHELQEAQRRLGDAEQLFEENDSKQTAANGDTIRQLEDALDEAEARIREAEEELENLRADLNEAIMQSGAAERDLESERRLRRDAENRELDVRGQLEASRRLAVKTGDVDVESAQNLIEAERRWQDEADARQEAEDRGREAAQEVRRLQSELDQISHRCRELESFVLEMDEERTGGLVPHEEMQIALDDLEERQAAELRQVHDELSANQRQIRKLEDDLQKARDVATRLETKFKRESSTVMLPNGHQMDVTTLSRAYPELKSALEKRSAECEQWKREAERLSKKLERRKEWINKTVDRLSEMNSRPSYEEGASPRPSNSAQSECSSPNKSSASSAAADTGAIDSLRHGSSAASYQQATALAKERSGAQAPTPRRAAVGRDPTRPRSLRVVE